jgi:hypothetical protein
VIYIKKTGLVGTEKAKSGDTEDTENSFQYPLESYTEGTEKNIQKRTNIQELLRELRVLRAKQHLGYSSSRLSPGVSPRSSFIPH